MTLAPSLNETLTRVRSDLRMGVPFGLWLMEIRRW